MTAQLYLSPRCFLCKVVEPYVVAWARSRGVALAVFKLYPSGQAVQVNGPVREAGVTLPATPALRVAGITFIGIGMLGALAQFGR